MARSAKGPGPETGASDSDSEFARRLQACGVELNHVYRSLRRHGVRAADAEDLAQEVFLIAWRRRADFDYRRPLRPWLTGIAFKLAHEHHRRRPPEFRAIDDLDPEPAGAELRPESLDARQLVLRVLRTLPERHRNVLVLHDLDGLSVDQIADLWAVPRFTLYTRLRRARRAFAQEATRLQAEQPARRSASAAALLALERPAPPAPEGLRQRLRRRLKSLLPELDRQPPTRTPLLARFIPVLGMSAVLCLAVGAGALLVPVATRSRAKEPARPSLAARPVSVVRRGLRPVRIASPLPREDRSLAAESQRDLIGLWPFDDGPGSTAAADRSAGGRDCQLRKLDPAGAWVPGLRGGALELGFNGWLDCPQPPLPPRRTAALTVAVWVKRSGTPPMHRALAMRPMGVGRGNYFFFGFVGDSLTVSSSGWSGRLNAPFAEPPGRWVHVAFTHDSEHLLKLYIHGVEVARRRTSARRFGAVEGSLLVGAGLEGSARDRVGQRFEGALDELRVYERALTDAEIGALAQP
jgi:RNA polymerase sigma-70 factor (ECF subfamily)